MTTDAIFITLNGEAAEVPSGLTVAQLLRQRGLNPEESGIAVAVAQQVVPRAKWDEAEVEAGAEIEIVTATQGG